MSYKKFLITIGSFTILGMTGLAVFYAANHFKTISDPIFTKPDIPANIAMAFSRDFSTMRAADEAMFLPDEAFMDSDGRSKKIVDFHGKPLLVNFWATWCAPCVVELPSLKRFSEHYEGKLQVIGIALEAGKGPAEIAAFLDKRGLGKFAGYSDKNGLFAGKLGLRGIPTSFLIGSDGVILYRFEGDADWTSAQSKAFFDVYLSQDQSVTGE